MVEGSQREVYEALDEYVENEVINLKRNIPALKLDDILLIDESYAVVLPSILPNIKREAEFFPLQFREARRLLARVIRSNPDELTKKTTSPRISPIRSTDTPWS